MAVWGGAVRWGGDVRCGGVEVGSVFDDVLGGAGGVGVDGKWVFGGEVEVALDTDAERAGVLGNFAEADPAEFGAAHAKIGETEGEFVGIAAPWGLNNLTTGLWSASGVALLAMRRARWALVVSFMGFPVGS